MATILKPLAVLSAILAILAGAGLLCTVSSTLTGAQVYGLIAFIAGGTAVAGGLSLPSTTTESWVALFPHLVLILSVIALTVCLGLNNTFNGTEVMGVFSFIFGGSAIGAGSTIITTKLAALSGPPSRARRGAHSRGASADFVDTTTFREP
jgi:hypothetical protein